ncbi:iron-containing alcohol dehydrogenase [Streptomyces sp. RS2]|uniref:iron-containing alcohol dehydrogenase n=1 Tax=Streptomyces sp. RS2 TaxID=1451205 RepID=UPI0021F8BDE2|nr:iron-containing alcohol dehydrogenase [Streptomyces sp. RS2]MCW1100122.1 iron-containing alcohol dehydrogenase [Streptomyces sp. RS2]
MTYSSPTSTASPLGVLRLPRNVVLGAGQRRALGPLVAEIGRRVLVCTDARMAASAEYGEMCKALTDAGVEVITWGQTEPELPVTSILRCTHQIASTTVDAVIGLGGGSCLDMAKVVALLLTHGGQPSDYYGENRVPGPTVPVIAIPTTAGTGSEATPVAVLADPDLDMKVGISSPYLIPQLALIDPELTYTCPPGLTAAAGIDAVVHLVESFTAVLRTPSATLATERVFVGKNSLTDGFALQGLSLMARSLPTAYRTPGDPRARHDVMLAALYGGIALGTAGTAAAHALQYPIGALTHTPHGMGTGCLLPYVMRFNLPYRVDEFAQIASAMGVSVPNGSTADLARAGIEAVDALVDAVNVPSTLRELGVQRAHLPTIARQCLKSIRLIENNPRPIDERAALTIATAAFEGDRAFPAF